MKGKNGLPETGEDWHVKARRDSSHKVMLTWAALTKGTADACDIRILPFLQMQRKITFGIHFLRS